jgi:uncharacterized protein
VGDTEYHLIHRMGRWGRTGWARPIIGVIAAVVLLFVLAQAVGLGFAVWFAINGTDIGDGLARLADTDHVTPSSLAYLNLTLACAIPATMIVTRLVHGLRPGWLASVLPRIRWRWLLTCLGLAVIALIATLVVGAFLPVQGGDGTDMDGSLNAWTPTIRDFVLVVVFLTPLQAAGEEYAFRGYLTQVFGGLFRRRWAAVLLPALLFALSHGAQDLPIFFDRFAFGLVAGILVIATGGLEAGIAMHVLNNFLAFGLALAFSDMSSALNPTGGSWWNIPVTLTQSLVYLALAIWAARRIGVRTTVDRGPSLSVLGAPEPRV